MGSGIQYSQQPGVSSEENTSLSVFVANRILMTSQGTNLIKISLR
uniref:Uncharacterized protein n=1 Tax=Nelumbo nucifera TaxID=4432 RepID=A0A822YDT9_NELNU|nr:TPA_asm: hypothetical protein HUJ06_009581 [Nelumbo nucifera]